MTLAIALMLTLQARALVITFEGNDLPEALGWQRIATTNLERRVESGWLIQTIQHGQDFYRMPLTAFVDSENFFVEWRMMTDNPEWLIYEFQTSTVVVAGGNGPGFYHVVMTESAAVLYRDINIPWVVIPFSIDEPHTYRIEILADEYVWYIDGVVANSGVPEGPYPDPTARLSWGAEVIHEDAPTATTAWDYVRAGRIPDDASGDYDSDAAVTLIDQYFVVDCLTKDGPGIFGGPGEDAGPGCRFADFDADHVLTSRISPSSKTYSAGIEQFCSPVPGATALEQCQHMTLYCIMRLAGGGIAVRPHCYSAASPFDPNGVAPHSPG